MSIWQSGWTCFQNRFQLGKRGSSAIHSGHHFKGVTQPLENLRRKNLLIRQIAETRSQSEQMAHEVAAVHTRHITREEWFKCAGVIPIVKMSVMPLQAFHRRDSRFSAFDQSA